MELSIIIVNWNVEALLHKCLGSIYRYTNRNKVEVIVVDNASHDHSITMIRENFPDVVVIANQKNVGFATANNQGVAQSKGTYILLLNPDTEIKENTIATALAFFKTHEKIGALGCRLQNPDGSLQPSVRRFPSVAALLLILTKIAKLFPHVPPLERYLAKDFDYAYAQKVDQVMGAFLLTSREVYTSVGGLDERFFIWFEEVDFCRKIYQSGREVWYIPDAEIIHYGGQSFQQALTIKKQWLFFKSAWRYFTLNVFKK